MHDDEPEKKRPSSPWNPGLLGIGLLLTSVFIAQSRDPGDLLYVGRFLFLAGLALLAWTGYLWYRQAQDPDQERDAEL